MKKVLVILIGLLLLISTQAYAVGTCTESIYYRNSDNGIVAKKIACTADVSAATFPNTSIVIDGYILRVETDPGGTAPTDLYDIVLNSASASVDIMGGELANRSTTASEQAMPKIGNGYGVTYVDTVTMAITNNSVNSALIDVYIWLLTDVSVTYY